MRRILFLALVAACGNDLLPPGECTIPVATGEPVVTPLPLVGQAATFDDLHYAPLLGKVLAAPEGVGRLFVVDPETLEVATIGTSGGTTSADADATTIYALDRSNNRLVAYDASSGEMVTALSLDANPDYVRVVPGGGELWITLPGASRIDVVAITAAPVALARVASIALPGAPEGLTFGAGRGYTQTGGRAITIDLERRLVIGEHDTGCGASHGFPQIDDGYGIVVGGCGTAGGAATVSRDGRPLAGFEAGGEAAVLAYDGARHHLYLRGDPGSNLMMIAVCPDGGMSVMAEVPTSDQGHASTVDELGNVWIADATTGGLFRISDPFASTE
jgi:hypothetical protein